MLLTIANPAANVHFMLVLEIVKKNQKKTELEMRKKLIQGIHVEAPKELTVYIMKHENNGML